MKKKLLIGSIIAVALLTLVSFSNVVGYSSVDKNPVPDLDCDGTLDWIDVTPGETVTDTITVENIGVPESMLNWEIESYPDWGNWTCDPEYGTGVLPGEMITIDVECVFPNPAEEEHWSELLIVNTDNPDDFCVIDAYYPGEAVPVVKNIKQKSIDDDLIEIDVEFCGLGKKHTVKLTQQEADEVEILFADIKQRLSEVETKGEAEEIFKEAVVKLGEYNLIPKSMNVEYIQDFITRKFASPSTMRSCLLDNKLINCNYMDPDENYNCLIVGESTEDFTVTFYQGLPFRITNNIAWFIARIGIFLNNDALVTLASGIMEILGLLLAFRLFSIPTPYDGDIPLFQRPFMIGGGINYGVQELSTDYLIPSEGWVSTYGSNGHKNWTGEFYGHLNGSLNWPFLWNIGFMLSYPGVSGFFGLVFKYKNNEFSYYPTKYLGFAFKVKLGSEPPYVLDVDD